MAYLGIWVLQDKASVPACGDKTLTFSAAFHLNTFPSAVHLSFISFITQPGHTTAMIYKNIHNHAFCACICIVYYLKEGDILRVLFMVHILLVKWCVSNVQLDLHWPLYQKGYCYVMALLNARAVSDRSLLSARTAEQVSDEQGSEG